jgi:DNA end-binding protein Ku
MARAMWKASLELGDVRVPVKLYAGVDDRRVHFRLLHAKDRAPVRQRMIDPRDEREVPSEEVRRGVELEEGLFVVLRGEELASVQPEASRRLELLRFVPPAAIDLSWYSRPYFLGPDGSDADYFALAEALRASERRGIARWVMRGQRHLGVLAPHGDHLALVALHAAGEVVAADRLARPGGSAVSAGERKLAEQLLATLDAPFDPADLRDEHRERVEKLIEAKREGRTFAVTEAAPPRARGDLGDVLRRSLAAARERRRAAA